MKNKSKKRKIQFIVFIITLAGCFYFPATHSQLFNPSCYESFANNLISKLKNKSKEEISEILKKEDVNYPALLRQLFDKKPLNQKDIIRVVGNIKPDFLAKSLKGLREKVSDEDKLFMAQVIVKSLRDQLPNSSLNASQIYEILFEQVIAHFSTIEWWRKNKNINLKKQVKDARGKIYDLFKVHPQYISVKTLRGLAGGVKNPNYKTDQKIAHIRILKEFSDKKTLKDILTIQRLGEGLTDFDLEVRQNTAETLGQILSKKMGIFNDNVLLNILTQKPLNYLLPLFIAYSLTPKDLYIIVDMLIVSAVVIGLPLWHSFSDPSQTRDIRWHISEQLYKAVYDPEIKVRQLAVQSIGQMKHTYPFLIDALIETFAFSSADEVKKQALKSLQDSLEKLYLGKWVYFVSEFRYKERKEENVINHIVKPLYGVYDKRNEHRRIILEYLKKKKIEPKKYYSVQDKKAKELEKEKKNYREKNIKTIREDSNNNNVPPPFDSWFEVDVFLELHKKGYIVLPQFPVPKKNNDSSFYYIDLVVLDSKNQQNKLAVECDGEGFHSGEDKRKEDSERQQILEEKGWRFQRVTYSSFSREKNRNGDKEPLSDLWKTLREMKIKPDSRASLK